LVNTWLQQIYAFLFVPSNHYSYLNLSTQIVAFDLVTNISILLLNYKFAIHLNAESEKSLRILAFCQGFKIILEDK